MNLKILKPKQSLNKAYLKEKVNRKDIEQLKSNLKTFLNGIDEKESEEHAKNKVTKFLYDSYYNGKNEINTKGRIDLAIYEDQKPVVIIEAKRPKKQDSDMVHKDNLNAKAMHELILYYLREKIDHSNNDIHYLVATNIYEWFIFDASIFEKLFYKNKALEKDYNDWKMGRKSGTDTSFFYNEIAKPFLDKLEDEISFTWFDFKEVEKIINNNKLEDDLALIPLYKLLSPAHLLKQPFANDSNSLDTKFYTELLHIIGLEEIKDGSKKLIKQKEKSDTASLLENTIVKLEDKEVLRNIPNLSTYGENKKDQLFNISLELCITWINRILFLKLLEAQLYKYHKGNKEYVFLNTQTIFDFDELSNLFFQVLAEKQINRREHIKEKYSKVPYLNSSLFERTELERVTFDISALDNRLELPLFTETVLKEVKGKRKTGKLPVLKYLFDFLEAYDFTSEGKEEIQEENKNLINASVLGLIFEKINGYKEGSFFTPGFVTMYMCRETVRRSIIQKFNERYKIDCETFEDLKNFVASRFKVKDILEFNTVINELRICDPAVGSGHFLVSALNELIAIKAELGILADKEGLRLSGYEVKIENDELIITYNNNSEIFEYSVTNGSVNKETQRIQKTLFHEKETIIENCLFGVDINPNSVKICRLRLWIELLKNAYYKDVDSSTNIGGIELETLPNIDINIKCGNSLISRFALDEDLKNALKGNKRWTIDTYKIAVQSYRHAKSKEEKRDLEELIDEIKENFKSEITKDDKTDLSKARGEVTKIQSEINKIIQWGEKVPKEINAKLEKALEKLTKLEKNKEDILNNVIYKNAFEWRFEFPEVLDSEGNFIGFDVVIGNPPYGDYFTLAEKEFTIKTYPESFSGTFDVYITFFGLSLKIIKDKGTLSYITPHTFIEYTQFSSVRQLLMSNNSISQIIKLTGVFEDAVVDNVIIFLTRNTEQIEFIKSKIFKSKLDKIDSSILDNSHHSILTKEGFSLQSLGGIDLNKLKIGSVSLGDYAKITQGITTGGNEFFIGSEQTFLNAEIPTEYIKKTLRGENVNRYELNFGEEFILYSVKTMSDIAHKKIESHLLHSKDKLSKKRETQQGKLPWYCLHWPRSKEDFERPKILIRQTASCIIGMLDCESYYPIDSIHTINIKKVKNNEIQELKYLLGLLNSSFFKYLYNCKLDEEGKVFPQIKKANIDWLPIKISSQEHPRKIENIVDVIINTKKQNPITDTSILEKEIDQLVYSLYGLTEDEIKIIEHTTKQ